jgi:beta-galactosidase
MKMRLMILFVWTLVSFPAFSQKQDVEIREHLLMDFGWRFALGHATDYAKDFTTGTGYFTYFAKTGYGDGAAAAQFKDSTWREVDLPHDWAVELPFSGDASHSHGYKTIGYKYPETSVGWYRKKFTVPASDFGRKISIQFDGVHRNATVWVNGFYVGNEPSGYATSVYDITDYLNYGGENTVAVRVDASIEEGWYYEGAGIYRHVWLNKTDRLHVAQFGTFVTAELNGNNAELTVRTKVQNQHDKSSVFTIEQCLLDVNNQQVLSGKLENISLNGNVDNTYFQKIKVEKPTLWSLEDPYLYKLKTNIIAGGKIVDSYTTNVGIRTVRFDPNQGFFLNGKSVKIVGTNMHQDHAGVGTAIPDALQEFRIKKLKEMGNNGIRTSHNPPTPEMLDACDRLGMLVLDENRLMGINQEHFDLMERFIVRDRNHPSVVLWSVGNEEWKIEGNEKGARITKTMQEFAQKIDSSRAFTVAISGGWENGSGKTTQVMGYNYIVQGNIDEHHKNFPWQSGIGTEESNTIGTRGVYVDDKANGRMAASNRMPENVGTESGWKFYAARPFLSGLFFWTGFDYRGEANPLVWPAVNSQFGIVDLCGFPKDIFYYLKSWWGKQPVMHIMPHWNWKGSEGKNIKVTIYSNAEEVELVLNKKSLGKKTMEKNGHLEWEVAYQPGTLVAKGFVNGKPTVSEQVETTGTPAKVVLLADRSQLNADGEDVAVITVQLNDLKNRLVPTANKEIVFTLSGQGKIIGVGNGDPASHAPEQFVATASNPTPQWKRDTFNGLAQVIVKTTKQAGEITLTASSEGMTSTTLKLTTTTSVLIPTTEIIKK